MLTNQRFGNSLFIYAFCRGYAEAMGCELRTPPWIGQKIFQNVNEPPMSHLSIRLPQTYPDHLRPDLLGHFFGQKDIDIQAYCQHQVYLDFYTRKQAKEWFTLKQEYTLLPSDAHYCVAHKRRGDYLKPPFNKLYAAVSDASYEKAIDKYRVPRPVLSVEEGWKEPPERCKEIGAPWLYDFLLMLNAGFLLRANSSFSWWAAALGDGKVYSPVVGNKVGWQDCEFVEGNWPCTAGGFRNQSDLALKEE